MANMNIPNKVPLLPGHQFSDPFVRDLHQQVLNPSIESGSLQDPTVQRYRWCHARYASLQFDLATYSGASHSNIEQASPRKEQCIRHARFHNCFAKPSVNPMLGLIR